MLRWALLFFVLSCVAALFGFGGISHDFAEAAKFLFWAFVALFVVTVIAGIWAGEKIKDFVTGRP